MKTFKKILFYATCIPLGLLLIIVQFLICILEYSVELFHRYELFCMGSPEGMVYDGNGIWISEEWANLKKEKLNGN